jgi:hypothetical protein
MIQIKHCGQQKCISLSGQQHQPGFLDKGPTPDSELLRRRTENKPNPSTLARATPSKQKKAKQVTFSEYSTLCSYPLDRRYESNKSYTSSERKAFQTKASVDSKRIQHLIASHPTQDSLTLNRLIQTNVVQIEDFLGLEHLITEKGRYHLIKQRRTHTALLLKKQKELRGKHIQDEYLLASAVLKMSTKSVEKARLRAALAA